MLSRREGHKGQYRRWNFARFSPGLRKVSYFLVGFSLRRAIDAQGVLRSDLEWARF